LVALFALAVGLSACTGGGSTGSYNPYTPSNAPNATNPSKTYVLTSQVSVPNVPPKSGTWSFDIGYVDTATKEYYLADRTNSGVDLISLLNNNSFLGVAGAGAFVGLSALGSNFSGPNGVAPIGNGNVMAGDGNSTTKIVNINSMLVVANIPNVNPYTGPALTALAGGQCNASGTPTTGSANGRADELAVDPTDGVAFIVNDISCPAFGTFISTTPPFNVLGTIAFTTATAGAEQPVWDPTQNKFLMAIPATIANPGGEIDVIDPKTFAITNVFPEPANCMGNGTAIGASENLFIGCSNVAGPLVIMNATNGATIATISGSGGCDEVWYNPTANRFYGACSNYTGGPNLAVIDASTNTLIAAPATSTGAHSVAVDPATDKVFVPQRAGGFNAVTIINH
jgi:hypothetical protein